METDYALYRYFDSAGRVLYIGKSGDVGRRDSAHIRRSQWMQFTASSVVERFATPEEVGDVERKAIGAEHPIFNRQYNDTPEARERLRVYLAEVGRPDLVPTRPETVPAAARPVPNRARPAKAKKSQQGEPWTFLPPGSDKWQVYRDMTLYRETRERRDEIIRACHVHGASIAEIARLMRISRPTVYEVLSEKPGRMEELARLAESLTRGEPAGVTRYVRIIPGTTKTPQRIVDLSRVFDRAGSCHELLLWIVHRTPAG